MGILFYWVFLSELIGTPPSWRRTTPLVLLTALTGVLALTSSKSGGLAGVFISVTTIPAAGNIAVATVFGLWQEVRGSAVTLVVNIVGMALAGWLTLAIQQGVWDRVKRRRSRRAEVAT